jgi:hypothetical protein
VVDAHAVHRRVEVAPLDANVVAAHDAATHAQVASAQVGQRQRRGRSGGHHVDIDEQHVCLGEEAAFNVHAADAGAHPVNANTALQHTALLAVEKCAVHHSEVGWLRDFAGRHVQPTEAIARAGSKCRGERTLDGAVDVDVDRRTADLDLFSDKRLDITIGVQLAGGARHLARKATEGAVVVGVGIESAARQQGERSRALGKVLLVGRIGRFALAFARFSFARFSFARFFAFAISDIVSADGSRWIDAPQRRRFTANKQHEQQRRKSTHGYVSATVIAARFNPMADASRCDVGAQCVCGIANRLEKQKALSAAASRWRWPPSLDRLRWPWRPRWLVPVRAPRGAGGSRAPTRAAHP